LTAPLMAYRKLTRTSEFPRRRRLFHYSDWKCGSIAIFLQTKLRNSATALLSRTRAQLKFLPITKYRGSALPQLPWQTIEAMTPICSVCKGACWVCEDHPDKTWGGAIDREDACYCGGAGMPCPACNESDREHKPKMPTGYRTIFDKNGWRN
jgi:hypothetical protein